MPMLQESTKRLSNSDIELDEKCIACVENYIANNSTKKGQHELALQAYRQLYQEQVKVEQGIRLAHGTA